MYMHFMIIFAISGPDYTYMYLQDYKTNCIDIKLQM